MTTLGTTLATSWTPAAEYETADRRRILLTTFRKVLSPRQYTVMVRLFGLEDGIERSYTEVARELQITVMAVKAAQQTAGLILAKMPKLRELLRDAVTRKRQVGHIHSPSGAE